MRIAALIVAYNNPDVLGRLLDRLQSPLWACFVHIDARAKLSQFAHLYAKAQFTDFRLPVKWGGFGLTAVALHLLQLAFEDPAITHFYLMSGACYPIKDDEYIRKVLAQSEGNFISCIKMPVWHKPLERIEAWNFNDFNRIARKGLNAIFRLVPRKDSQKLLRGIQPYGGATWWLLSRATVKLMLEFLRDNPWYIRAFRYSIIPDEMFFQTLLIHLGIMPDREGPTAHKFVDGAPHPQTITRSLLVELKGDWHFLARKFAPQPAETVRFGP